MRIAIYGGSFNPPHICHQFTILYLLETKSFDQVWLIPCYRHAFQKPLAAFETRISWCKSLIEPFKDKCKVDDIESKLANTSRTIDTIKALQKKHPADDFHLVLGSDIRQETDKWKDFDKLQKLVPIIWIGRNDNMENAQDALLLPDISSTKIREMIVNGEDISNFVPATILKSVLTENWKAISRKTS